MILIYITNQEISKEEAFNWFSFFCMDVADLYMFNTITSFKEFISKTIKDKGHIDLVITDWNFGNQNAREILNYIRESSYHYSDNNFVLRSIPVVLIEDVNQQSKTISEGFDATISDFPANKLKAKYVVKDVVKRWRYLLASDLELIGLDPKTLKEYPNQRKQFLSYYKLKVISRDFVDNKSKKLSYIWTGMRTDIMSDLNQLFYDKITRARNPNLKVSEKSFHDFFREYPTFLKRDKYSLEDKLMLYEKHFYKNGTKRYDEPDFVNVPLIHSLIPPEIFEIKRVDQKIINSRTNQFIYNAKKSFQQVERYKRYMLSDNPLHQQYIIRYLGQLYQEYQFTLLMGTRDEKEEYLDLIERLRRDFEFTDVKLITYEELLGKHIELCDQLNEYDIYK